MPGSGDEGTRAERWAASMAEDMNRGAWERRQEEHWERLHKQLYWLPGYFIGWSLAIAVGAVFVGMALGVSFAALGAFGK